MGYIFVPSMFVGIKRIGGEKDESVLSLHNIFIADIAEEEAVNKAREFFKNLDKTYHLNSEAWEIEYHDTKNEEKGTLGSTTSIRGQNFVLKIDIYPNAIGTQDTFFEVLRHEYAHALTIYRWGKDNHYLTHSNHGRLWQEAAKELGCKAKPSTNVWPYFNYLVVKKDCWKPMGTSSESIEYFATTLQEAENKMRALEDQKGLSGKLEIITGEEAYNSYKDEYKRRTLLREEAFDKESIKAHQYKIEKIQEQEDIIKESKDFINEISKSLEDFEQALILNTNFHITHSAFGEGIIKEVRDGKIKVQFKEEKTISLKWALSSDQMEFNLSPELNEQAQDLKYFLLQEDFIKEKGHKAKLEKERLSRIDEDEMYYEYKYKDQIADNKLRSMR